MSHTPERNALDTPRGGAGTFAWHKRPGWVCRSRAIDRAGHERLMWYPAERPAKDAPEPESPRIRRGAIGVEQGKLF